MSAAAVSRPGAQSRQWLVLAAVAGGEAGRVGNRRPGQPAEHGGRGAAHDEANIRCRRSGTSGCAVITQNGNAYTDGLGPGTAALAAWPKDRDVGQSAVDGFVSLAGTRMQWQAGARDPEYVDPEQAPPTSPLSTFLAAPTT